MLRVALHVSAAHVWSGGVSQVTIVVDSVRSPCGSFSPLGSVQVGFGRLHQVSVFLCFSSSVTLSRVGKSGMKDIGLAEATGKCLYFLFSWWHAG